MSGAPAARQRRALAHPPAARCRLAGAAAVLAVLAACTTTPPPAAVPAAGLTELLERDAERALLDGMRAYEDGRYLQAESALRKALGVGLGSPRDRATAHKLLAFIHCSSERIALCESEFRRARAADPGFALGRAEAGHPLWGPVYRRTLR